MTTVTDLRAELDRCADLAPSDAEIRQALAHLVRGRAERRRRTALIAAAVAVVLVAGGAGITGAVLSHRSGGPAAPTPVVSVPEVPLPAGTKLIRHQLRAVTTPVSATPPLGLTGQVWFSSPGRLAVSWFDPSQQTSHTAGYVVSAERDLPTTTSGDGRTTPATVSSTTVTVGGHPATLETAPSGSTDQLGLPAAQRITWKLGDGRWIAVWVDGHSGDTSALRAFAGGITEAPQTLNRTVGIGLTLPGLTVDSSINSSPLATAIGAQVYLCPTGVDPLAASSGSSSGSGSSGPDGSTSTESQTEDDPTARCVAAAVVNHPLDQSTLPAASTVTVGDTVAHVDPGEGAAWADLGNGLTAVAAAPQSAHLSAADLAALVASVRLSPAVTVLPLQSPQVVQMSGAASAVTLPSRGKAVPPPAKPSSSAVPVTASTGLEDSLLSSERAAESSARSAATSARSAASSARDDAAAVAILDTYLQALVVGDCTMADEFTAAAFEMGNGELCGDVQVSKHSSPKQLSTPNPDERDFEVTLTTDGSTDGSVPPGELTWFYVVQRQPGGGWLITGGGSGI